MADWEQRLRLYAAGSRQPSNSPMVTVTTEDPATATAVANHRVSDGGLAQQRARSPNALERLRTSTAMNLVALELRRADTAAAGRANSPTTTRPIATASSSSTSLAPPPETRGWGPMNEVVPPVAPYENRQSSSIPRTSSPTQHSPSPSHQYRTISSAYVPPPPLTGGSSTVARTSPLRSSMVGSGFVPASSAPSATSVLAESFNPQAILQMLDTKVRGLESRNHQLETSVQTLHQRNQDLQSELVTTEALLQNQTNLQTNIVSLQHEVDRLREELLVAAQREERRVEEIRRRSAAELDEERRRSAAMEQEIFSLRSAIRQLASIERGVDH